MQFRKEELDLSTNKRLAIWLIDKAKISYWGTFIIAIYFGFFSSFMPDVDPLILFEIVLAVIFIIFLLHMLIYPMCFLIFDMKKRSKILLLAFALLLPFASGYWTYCFKLFHKYKENNG